MFSLSQNHRPRLDSGRSEGSLWQVSKPCHRPQHDRSRVVCGLSLSRRLRLAEKSDVLNTAPLQDRAVVIVLAHRLAMTSKIQEEFPLQNCVVGIRMIRISYAGFSSLSRILSRRIAVFKLSNSARSLSEVALHKKSLAGFRTSPIRIRRSPMSNSHVQSAKAIAEDIAHLCCVPDDWRLQISNLAAWPLPTLCAKPRRGRRGENRRAQITLTWCVLVVTSAIKLPGHAGC